MQTALDGFLCEQTSRDHHAWVARVCAARNRCDEHAAVANVSTSARKYLARLRFNFLRGIGRWPVCNHLKLVALFAGADPLIFFVVRRKHRAITRRAAVQLHQMFFAEVDSLFSVAAVSHWFFEQFAKRFSKLG